MSDKDNFKWAEFLYTGMYSNFTIVCGGSEWKVHRVILCAQSPYFQKICKECYQEGENRRLELKEEDPDVIQAVLDFLYTGDYETDEIDYSQDVNALINRHVQVYACADKFCISDLKDVAAKKFDEQLSLLLEYVDSNNNNNEKGEVLATIIPEVYSTTPSTDRQLRDILTAKITEALPELLAGGNEEIASAFFGAGRCAWDVLVRKCDADFQRPRRNYCRR
ncbi:hypothetical protein VTN02DRAFT_5986 [Thermoascus thermophilus]